jgi:hypothetical protein
LAILFFTAEYTASTVLYTVPSGRTFYLYHASLSVSRATAGECRVQLVIRDASDVEVCKILTIGAEAGLYGDHGEISMPNPLPIPAGYDLYVVIAGGTVRVGVSGDEE